SSFSDVNAGFTSTVYSNLLYRQPSTQETQLWVTALNNGLSRPQMVEMVENSREHHRIIVDVLYHLFLGRAAEPGAVDGWTNFLDSGGTIEQLEETLVGSPEFFQVEGGGTEDGFIQAVYQDVLDRNPDDAGRDSFEQALDGGASPSEIARDV